MTKDISTVVAMINFLRDRYSIFILTYFAYLVSSNSEKRFSYITKWVKKKQKESKER